MPLVQSFTCCQVTGQTSGLGEQRSEYGATKSDPTVPSMGDTTLVETYIPDVPDEAAAPTAFDEEIALQRKILESTVPGDQDYVTALHSLGLELYRRFGSTGMIRDIEEATTCARECLKVWPPEHISYRNGLRNLAIYLEFRFKKKSRTEDIEESIGYGRRLLKICPPGHKDRQESLVDMSTFLTAGFDGVGKLEYIDEAIALGREALNLCPLGHPKRNTTLNGLALYLARRFTKTGMLEDLDEDIRILQDLLQIAPLGHEFHTETLTNLVQKLHKRFEITGRVGDLREEIEGRQQLRDESPPESWESPNPIHTLVRTLYSYLVSTKTKDRELIEFAIRCGDDIFVAIKDLDEEIKLRRELVELCPPDHELRGETQGNLTTSLHNRFKRDGRLEDLQEEIQRRQQLHAGGDLSRSASTYPLVQKLYTVLGAKEMTSLERKFAIDCGQTCLDSLSAMDFRRLKLRYQLKSIRGMQA